MEDDEQPKGFKVTDRRRFTESGDVREDADVRDEAAAEPAAAPPPGAEPAPAATSSASRPQLPEITLSTFLIGLSTQALMFLGEIPNPATGETGVDLAAVREVIDLIHMLQEKTRGNVDAAEAQLFEQILYDLRMRFVEKARK